MICNTCQKPDHSPWRVYGERGEVLLGCVDACHDGRIASPSASAFWHYRKDAKKIRAASKKSCHA